MQNIERFRLACGFVDGFIGAGSRITIVVKGVAVEIVGPGIGNGVDEA